MAAKEESYVDDCLVGVVAGNLADCSSDLRMFEAPGIVRVPDHTDWAAAGICSFLESCRKDPFEQEEHFRTRDETSDGSLLVAWNSVFAVC